ncbi:hypothetical protein QQ056_04840 [Oscillatoria laete-virens NRMC-F 0139]|nr:hypothetical protein [Oscillatoria laete-virens]MDL5052886.1 hypothetical protein [Oscillatoria laete-virens NRMC-F 0139]
MAPQIVPPLTRWFNTLTLTLGAIGGISILLDALRGRRKPTTFQGVVGAMAAGSLAAVIYDEASALHSGGERQRIRRGRHAAGNRPRPSGNAADGN